MSHGSGNVSGLVGAFVAKYERYIVAHDAKEFQKTFRLGHGKVARQYRRNGQGKICEFNDVEPRKFHKAVYAVSAHKVTLPGDCHAALAMTKSCDYCSLIVRAEQET